VTTALDVLAALSTLSEREREVLVDRRLLGLSQPEIAVSLGITKQGVSVIEQRAARKLRQRVAT
jgi:RNA polymerase sigma factor (sigma-70 family)